MDDILIKIRSKDVEVLRLSIYEAERKLDYSKSQIRNAETRALGVMAFQAALLAYIFDYAANNIKDIAGKTFFEEALGIAVFIFLAKAVFFASKIINVRKRSIVTEEGIYSYQLFKIADALRHQAAHLIWEYQKTLDVVQENLLRLNRSVRNTLYCLICFVAWGFLHNYELTDLRDDPCLSYVVGVLILGWCILSDVMHEYLGSFWSSGKG